ncbi:CehA/McbA family metallohydrolase [Duganella sp. BJB1802]|uniref:CehA/McbA family metallohydrolase n=1 Tax=Duganella sp. BJB1802 TaxID=2744575 RepID=UPI001593E7DE|nr:CehA/McbA family metallohydrolase [Duganella sp. BJB1802]NVD72092.1 CehA/McbA family metallohydrolase [Duganella sp. BJB1802]
MNKSKMLSRLAMMLMLSSGAIGAVHASKADHHEFEATLHAPFAADGADQDRPEARTFKLAFDFPLLEREQDVRWRLELVSPDGVVVQQWQGVQRIAGKPVDVSIAWDGRADGLILTDGVYLARMQAVTGDETVEQSWDISVGRNPAQAMPAFKALPTNTARARPTRQAGLVAQSVAATSSLPYTIYLGNLHSQTNHSDGGGPLGSCTGAQAPQSAALGPADAYQYAMNKGLDFLMASEHNHMYDGSDGTNASADPVTAKALFQSGLTAAANFNSAHANFLGMYGLEWGVINNGGHMNIFNTTELLGWESNSSGQLIADTLTPKNDYAALYTLMRQRGYIGQFNHPESSGQFLVNGTALGYTADGDQAMALCEVLNTSAFSTNTSESETGRSTYEGACNKALEAGYHVAFSSDQDNHCANWGVSYTNRTGVLLPTGTPLTTASMIAAIKARRVFATMDKTSQLILTANGHVMGERFTNSGTLNLVANFASSSGKTVSSVKMYEGVPGRNGTVTQLSATASTTITPAVGEHFYYAKITQNDGNILWSAPVWVTQTSGGGTTTPPTATQLIVNGGFESGAASWTATSGVISNDASQAAHAGSYKAWLDGYGSAHTDTLYQTVTIPADATSATLAFWLQVVSDETTTTTAYDTLKVQVRSGANAVLATLATYSNLNKGSTYVQKSFDLSAYKGQTVRIYFEGVEGSTVSTAFLIDDVTLNVQ